MITDGLALAVLPGGAARAGKGILSFGALWLPFPRFWRAGNDTEVACTVETA
jgi:hypothetical protein